MFEPRVYFGLHFSEGVASYDGGAEPDTIFIGEDTLKRMNSTFVGKPVFVGHQEVAQKDIRAQADGYVVESFFNKADGKSWAKFIVVSEEGEKAIKNGWRLSNSYSVVKSGDGGKWHNVEYNSEVLEGQYNHLAIVQTPRYNESIILTPEEFKAYNAQKESELLILQNEIKGSKSMFKFFKKSTVENSEEIAKSIVLLSNGREASVEELINIVNAIPEKEENCSKKNEDEKEEEKKNEDEKEEKEMDNEVDVDGEKVSMKDLIANWKGKKKNEAEKEEKEEEKKNEDEEEDKSKLNEIKNAIDTKEVIIDTTMNKVARGQNLYGSKK